MELGRTYTRLEDVEHNLCHACQCKHATYKEERRITAKPGRQATTQRGASYDAKGNAVHGHANGSTPLRGPVDGG